MKYHLAKGTPIKKEDGKFAYRMRTVSPSYSDIKLLIPSCNNNQPLFSEGQRVMKIKQFRELKDQSINLCCKKCLKRLLEVDNEKDLLKQC